MRPRWNTLEELLKDVEFVIEADSFARQILWETWATQAKGLGPDTDLRRLDWHDGSQGFLVQVGTLDERPINISVLADVINGHKILFYEAVSQVVDWKQIDEWFKKNCDPKYDKGYRNAHLDAMNFTNCVHFLENPS